MKFKCRNSIIFVAGAKYDPAIRAKTDNLFLRWTALLHDIGKPYCNQGELQHDVDINGKFFPESVPCVYDHPLIGADMGFDLLLEWGLPEDDANLIRRMIKYHMRMHQIENIKKYEYNLLYLPRNRYIPI